MNQFEAVAEKERAVIAAVAAAEATAAERLEEQRRADGERLARVNQAFKALLKQLVDQPAGLQSLREAERPSPIKT